MAVIFELPHGRSYSFEVERAISQVRGYLKDGRRVIASSSFQTHSIPMLMILAEAGPIPVYFLDTGYHFPDTLTYRDEITGLLGLDTLLRAISGHQTRAALALGQSVVHRRSRLLLLPQQDGPDGGDRC